MKKKLIGIIVLGLLLGFGITFLAQKEMTTETEAEVKQDQEKQSKRRVPLEELPGSRASYNIDIQQMEDLRFQITAEIEVVNESKSVWDDIGFYFIPNAMTKENIVPGLSLPGETEITSILEKKGEELSYTLNDAMLYVELEKKLNPGESTTIQVEYMLKPAIGGQRLARVKENFYLALWYPMLGRYTDGWDLHPYYHRGEFYDTGYGDYDITYNLAKEYLVASSADDGDIKPVTQGRLIAKNIKDFYLAFLDPNEWISETNKANDTVMRYFYPYDDRATLQKIAADGQKAFEYLEENIGDNPTRELDAIVNNSGMEYPNIVEIWNRQGRYKGVLVHELAHQWFYYMVSSDSYEESWLDESLTVLLADTYITLEYSGSSAGEKIGFHDAEIFASRPAQNKYANTPINQLAMESGTVLYGKIPIILRDFFKEQGGHEKTIEFLAAYFEEFKFQYVDTEAFVEFFNEYHGEDHTEFLKEWLILE